MTLYPNIVYSNNIAYEILRIAAVELFLNKDRSVNKHVLGLYVHECNGDHVLQKENKFLICRSIEEAQIII